MPDAIVIQTVPDGPGPFEIREEWLGLVLPLATKADLARYPILQIRLELDGNDWYIVRWHYAISALALRGSTDAVRYWREHRQGPFVRFDKRLCTKASTN